MLILKQSSRAKRYSCLLWFCAFWALSSHAQDVSCVYQKGILYGYWITDTTEADFTARVSNLAAALGGAKITRKYPNHNPTENTQLADLSRLVDIHFDSLITTESALQQCFKSKLFEWVEPAYQYQSFWNPNDSLFSSQDALSRISLPATWNITTGDSNQVIALVDLGFQVNHPDLTSKFKINQLDPIDGLDNDADGFIDNFLGWDFGNHDADVSYGSGNTQIHHGTWVAGIAGAATNNTTGVAGVAPWAKLLPIKTCSDQSPSVIFGYEGIIYAADHGATVINASWGGPCDSQFGRLAVRYATQSKNCIIVAAAGNNNARKANYPAAYPDVISVASTDGSDIRCSSSSYHPTVDITAPGNVVTTNYPNTYLFGGCATSYAAPIVSGVAALLRSYFPNESNRQITARILNNTDSIYFLNSGFLNQLGSGRINALRAIQNTGSGVWLDNPMIIPAQPKPGDTVSISFQLKNLFSSLSQTYVKLTPELPNYLSAVDDSVYIGTFAGGQQLNVSGFRLVVAQACPVNSNLYCFATISLDGFFQTIPIEIPTNQTFATLEGLGYQVSIDQRGKFGYPDFPPDYAVGRGLQFRNKCSVLYEGGCVFGTFPNTVSNNIRNEVYLLDNDLVNTQPLQSITSAIGGTAIQVSFNDMMAPVVSNLQVNQEWVAFQDSSLFGLGMVMMNLYNSNSTALDSQYIGLFSDWDVGDFYNQNRANFDAACRLAYAHPYDTLRFPIWVGMTSLDDSLPVNCYSDEGTFNFSRFNKYNAVSSGISHVTAGQSGTGSDVIQFISVGPLSIPANATRTIAFGFASGGSLAELQQNCAALHQRYQCYSFKTDWAVSDTFLATGDTLFATATTPANSWLWDFGDGTTSTGSQVQHFYSHSGSYYLRLIATQGNCQDTLTQLITISTTTGNFIKNSEIQVATKPELLIFRNIPKHSTVVVSDMLGHIAYQGRAEETLQLPLTGGLYGYWIVNEFTSKNHHGKVFIPFLR